ncbi:MAG TPA: DUF4339 domain-containing protein [Methylocystis sp.]|nr:DUF4339 domain-containing protein [Methylocystis sp.]
MAEEWYYAEDGESLGPVSRAEIARRVRRAPQHRHYVWTSGMSDWTDARELPELFSADLVEERSASPAAQAPAKSGSLVQRARHELVAYLAISSYLLIWFTAVLFYKSTILRGIGIEFAPFGLAAIKALILGKFILVLEALKIGEGKNENAVLIFGILKRAALFTLLLFALSVGEELAVGHLHGRQAREVLSEIGGGTVPQAAATAVLMFLVLLPYLAFRRLASIFGELPELLFTLRPAKAGELAARRGLQDVQ